LRKAGRPGAQDAAAARKIRLIKLSLIRIRSPLIILDLQQFSVQAPILHTIHQQHFWLSAHRAAYWEEEKALILSDLHFGKTGHFRKSGIAVPQTVYKEDLQRLVELLLHFQPRQMI